MAVCPSGCLVTMRIGGMEGSIDLGGVGFGSRKLDLGMWLMPWYVGGGGDIEDIS